jgi:hypothetical protein
VEQTTARHALRSALHALRIAYAQGDAAQLHDAYVDAGRTSALLRIVLPVMETVYPVRSTLAFAATLEASMAEHGIHKGCERFFQGLRIPWGIDLPQDVRDIARNAPVIFFGNHPSLFTPFLAAASIDRPDFRWFSTRYVCNLLPTIRAASFPMEVPLTRSWTEWRRGGWQRALIYRIIALVHDMPAEDEIRAANRASLLAGAEYVRQGGSVIICPGGGGKAKDRKWYAGIGSLVRELQQSPGDRTVYLLPFREENCSNKRIYAYIQRGPISRIKNATVYRGPIRIRFGRPIPVAEVGTSDLTVQQIVDILKAYYERLFLEPAIAVPS